MESHLRPCFVSHTLIYVNQNGALDALRVLNDSPIEKAEPYYYITLRYVWHSLEVCIGYMSHHALPFPVSAVCLHTLVTCTNVCIKKLCIPIL